MLRREREAELVGYRSDPVGYVTNRLGMSFWWRQSETAQALADYGRVMVESANGVGKTAAVGAIASWFHDCFNPGICIITAPRAEQVETITFKEIRRHLGGRRGLAPTAPFLRDTPNHFIQGTTATDATSFHGHHDAAMLIIFEEATGIDPQFWEAARGMLQGGSKTYWLCILNPTDPDSHAHLERSATHPDGSKVWRVISISALEHPNIWANLQGEPDVIDGAVNLRGVVENMASDETWGIWVDPELYDPETCVDLWDATNYGKLDPVMPDRVLHGAMAAFPRRYWRPGPIGEARILGRYPSQALYSVFSEAMFAEAAARAGRIPEVTDLPEIGCDVARFGDDKTVAVVQRCGKFLRQEIRAKQDTSETAKMLRDLADEVAKPLDLNPRLVPIRIDDSGVGGGVTDQSEGYLFVPVIAQSKPMNDFRYPDKRSEIMFCLAERLKTDADLSAMGPAAKHELVKQATKVGWKPDARGRRRVLAKQLVKDKLGGRSPDELDAFGLAYYRFGPSTSTATRPAEAAVDQDPLHRREFGAGSRRLFS